MKILLAGEGGQGVQLAGEILAYAAFLEGKETSIIPNFGVEQRGGVSLAYIILGEDTSYPKFEKADLLVVFCDRAIERVEKYIGEGTKVIVGPAVTKEVGSVKCEVRSEDLPNKVWNILIVGKILEITNVVSKDSIVKALEEKLGSKFQAHPELKELNMKALG